MSTVIDRRGHSKGKEISSRQRFIQRNKKHVREAINRKISDGNVTDIGKGGTDVTVPQDGIKEPTIHHGKGGVVKRVFPGNKEFTKGDKLPKPKGGGGGGSGEGEASNDGEGEDDFVFHISEEEFLNILFEDLELPNLTKRNNTKSEETRPEYAGIVSSGPYSKLDLVRSKKKKVERGVARGAAFNDEIIALLEQQRDIFKKYSDGGSVAKVATLGKPSKKQKITQLEKELAVLKKEAEPLLSEEDAEKVGALEGKIAEAQDSKKSASKKIAWNDSYDLRFKFHEQRPVPTTKAVMFCLMDVSGSMDQEMKDRAKIFYFLLYRFLQRNYEQTDIVFIRHTQDAQEVDEQDFFYNRQTGGTQVSSALNLMKEIQEERYSESEWNIYGAQASDGDNWGNDNYECEALLRELLPKVQGYFYTEVPGSWGRGRESDLWATYEALASEFSDRFWINKIEERKDIFPVFKEFFKKRDYVESDPGYDAAAMKLEL